jgi:hypothetical protein
MYHAEKYILYLREYFFSWEIMTRLVFLLPLNNDAIHVMIRLRDQFQQIHSLNAG